MCLFLPVIWRITDSARVITFLITVTYPTWLRGSKSSSVLSRLKLIYPQALLGRNQTNGPTSSPALTVYLEFGICQLSRWCLGLGQVGVFSSWSPHHYTLSRLLHKKNLAKPWLPHGNVVPTFFALVMSKDGTIVTIFTIAESWIDPGLVSGKKCEGGFAPFLSYCRYWLAMNEAQMIHISLAKVPGCDSDKRKVPDNDGV